MEKLNSINKTFHSMKDWRPCPLDKYNARLCNLKILESYIDKNLDKFLEALEKDLERSFDESSIIEIYPLKSELNLAIKKLRKWMKPKRVSSPISYCGVKTRIHYEPKGTVLIISPWNFPFLLSLGPLISAIAAGNKVILKPSEFTPASNKIIENIVEQYFDKDEVSVIQGGANTAQYLTTLPFDHIFFTGNSSVGKKVQAEAAKNLTSTTLELGGKSPVIVDKTANIKNTVQCLVSSKLTNAGQFCIAPDYVLVHIGIYHEFLDELIKYTKESYSRDDACKPLRPVRMIDFLEDARRKGATVHREHKEFPIVVSDVNDSMELMKQEIFGPILPIIMYSNINEVIDKINSKEKPLAMYIFSQDKNVTDYIIDNTSSGGVVVNETTLQFTHPDIPFGGVNHSGIGKAHGHAGFLAFSNEKPVLKVHAYNTFYNIFRQPYSKLFHFLLKILLKFPGV